MCVVGGEGGAWVGELHFMDHGNRWCVLQVDGLVLASQSTVQLVGRWVEPLRAML